MRRNENRLPDRRDWPGSLSPASQSDLFSPSTLLASPWQMMRRMQEDMDRVFGQFFGSPFGSGGVPAQAGQPAGLQQWAPSVDISQNDKEWCIETDLPGVKPEDIDLQVQDQYLILRAELRPEEAPQGQQAEGQSGQQPTGQKQNGQQQEQPQRQYHHRERRWGYFERVLPLPENVDEGKVSCDFQHGVLTIHLPKTEPQAAQGRRIPIGAGQSSAASGQTGSRASQSQAGERAMAGAKGGETPPSEG
jgi:HSP20 family protein